MRLQWVQVVEYRESRGNRAGDGIRAAGAGSGRDRAGTFPTEGYAQFNLTGLELGTIQFYGVGIMHNSILWGWNKAQFNFMGLELGTIHFNVVGIGHSSI